MLLSSGKVQCDLRVRGVFVDATSLNAVIEAGILPIDDVMALDAINKD